MLKQYKILVNEGKGSENVLVTVPAGAGASGNPTRIKAKPDTRYELQDDLKGKGLAPDQVRGKRVGKNLYLMFEDNGKPDVIIEGYYDSVNLQQVPTIVGKAENGSIYEYIPHDPELSSMSTTLKDGYTPAMLSLGGGPIAGGAFELAGLPLVAAAAGGGLGGLGLLAAGLGAAALGGGGGGGGGAGGDTTPPSKPKSLVIPESTNGGVSADEAKDGTTLEVGLPADAVVGDVLKTVVTKPDGTTKITLDPVTLTAAMIADKLVKQTIPEGVLKGDGVWTTSSTLTDAAGNVSTPIDGTFTLDTTAPTPEVKIESDSDQNTLISVNELNPTPNEPTSATPVIVSATFADKLNLKIGDTVTFTDSVSKLSYVETVKASDLLQGIVTTTKFGKLIDKQSLSITAVLTDALANTSATSNIAIATRDATAQTGHLDHTSTNDTGPDVNDSYTSVNKPFIVGAAAPGAFVQIVINGKTYPLAPQKVQPNGQYSIQITDVLPDGEYIPVVRVTDASNKTYDVNGDKFTVDTDPAKNPEGTSLAPDANIGKTISITTIVDGSTDSQDTGNAGDFITSDNTLSYLGKIVSYTANGDWVKLVLTPQSGGTSVIRYEKPLSDGTWKWDYHAIVQNEGVYSLVATIVDAAGNSIANTNSANKDITIVTTPPKAASPEIVITAVESGGYQNNIAGINPSGNVLLGATASQGQTLKAIAKTYTGLYGDLVLSVDGTYVYTVANRDSSKTYTAAESARLNKVDALKNNSGTDVFDYSIVDAAGLVATAKLKVNITGVNDAPEFTVQALGQVNPTTGSYSISPTIISVADPDSTLESGFITPGVSIGKYGSFQITNSAGVSDWSYLADETKLPNGALNLIQGFVGHDLLTVKSIDGTKYQTFDVTIKGTDDTKHNYYYNISDTTGLEVVGGSTNKNTVPIVNRVDALILNKDNVTLDLTAVGSTAARIDNIEVINLGVGASTANNKITLNLNTVLQSENDILYIKGDADDTVIVTGGAVLNGTNQAPDGLAYKDYTFIQSNGLVHHLYVDQTIHVLL